jgi:hypothetical protein
MITSTPTTPEGGAAADPPPRQEMLATVAEQVAAIDALLGLAKHSIRVFDADLSGMGWNDAARAERIMAFLRSNPAAKVEIIVHDTGWIERSCPRLLNLLKYRGHAIAIRRTGEDARLAMDPLLIVDGVHFLHRFHASQPRAALSVGDPVAAQPLVIRFDAISADAQPGLTPTVLGL